MPLITVSPVHAGYSVGCFFVGLLVGRCFGFLTGKKQEARSTNARFVVRLGHIPSGSYHRRGGHAISSSPTRPPDPLPTNPTESAAPTDRPSPELQGGRSVHFKSSRRLGTRVDPKFSLPRCARRVRPSQVGTREFQEASLSSYGLHLLSWTVWAA